LSSGFSPDIHLIKQGYFFLRIPARSTGQDGRKGLIGILAARVWALEELVTEIRAALLCADLLHSYIDAPVRHDPAVLQNDNPHTFG
jgi:hypothetical protein